MNENPYKEKIKKKCVANYFVIFFFFVLGYIVRRRHFDFQRFQSYIFVVKSNGLTYILALCERKRKPIINRLV